MVATAVDAIHASRELDALVAEKVMGWHRDAIGPTFQGAQITSDSVPPYSTSIAAAWEVVEKLDDRFRFDCTNKYNHSPNRNRIEWGAWFISPTMTANGYASTAPLAICRAALKAVGI